MSGHLSFLVFVEVDFPGSGKMINYIMVVRKITEVVSYERCVFLLQYQM